MTKAMTTHLDVVSAEQSLFSLPYSRAPLPK